MKTTGPAFLWSALLTRHAGASAPCWREAEEQAQQLGVLRDPNAALWGVPSWVSILPDQLPKLVLKTSEICTTHLLSQCRIPQVQDKPQAAPQAAAGTARTSLCWVAGWCGAGRALSSPAGAPALAQPARVVTQALFPFLALGSAVNLAESWQRQRAGRREEEPQDHSMAVQQF